MSLFQNAPRSLKDAQGNRMRGVGVDAATVERRRMALMTTMAARLSAAFAPLVLWTGSLRAEDLPPGMGQPKPWQLGLQAPATPVME
ncbi:MAG: hypothetical protein ACK5TD_00970, partial [bacterium]